MYLKLDYFSDGYHNRGPLRGQFTFYWLVFALYILFTKFKISSFTDYRDRRQSKSCNSPTR